MKRKIGVSRKRRVRGGGKEEDLLRVIGAPNPQVNTNTAVGRVTYNEDRAFMVEIPDNELLHDPEQPRPRRVNMVQKERVKQSLTSNKGRRYYTEKFERPGRRVFITTHGAVGYDHTKIPSDWSILIHSEGHRLPNAHLLKIFENTFLWTTCRSNDENNRERGERKEKMSENIIQHSNICRVFGTLFMRFKIIEEKLEKRRVKGDKIIRISEFIEIEAILYLFINLINAFRDNKLDEWLHHEDLFLIKEIARLPPFIFLTMFKNILSEGVLRVIGPNIERGQVMIDQAVIDCLVSIRENGYTYIKNLFDRAITKLYMLDELLLETADGKKYDVAEFDRFFKSHSNPSDNNTLNITLPLPLPPLMNDPPLIFENVNPKNYNIELAKRTLAANGTPFYTDNAMEFVEKMTQHHSNKWNEYIERTKAENAAKKVLASMNSQKPGGGTRRTRRIRRTRHSRV